MESFQRDRYLRRLGINTSPPVTLSGLVALQYAHLRSIPFENLDIRKGIPVGLSQLEAVEKIVHRGRGGFCYELNSAFADLLETLGFKVKTLSARVATGAGGFGPPFDHLILLVDLDAQYLVDVGFGDSFIQPLLLKSGKEQMDRASSYMVLELGDEWALCKKVPDSSWTVELLFSLATYTLEDFRERCLWTQTSPDSHFVQKDICTLLTEQGRTTLSGDRMIIKTGASRIELPIATELDRRARLLEHFGVVPD